MAIQAQIDVKTQEDVKEQQTNDETQHELQSQILNKNKEEEITEFTQNDKDELQKMDVAVGNDAMDELTKCDKITALGNNDKSHAQQKVDLVHAETLDKITTATENSQKSNSNNVDLEKSNDVDKNTRTAAEEILAKNNDIELIKREIKKEVQHDTKNQQKMHVNDEHNHNDHIKCEKMPEVKLETNEQTKVTTNTNDETAIETKAVEVEMEVEEVENLEKITSLKSLGPFIAAKDNARNTIYINDFPEICKTKPCMLGVDEAGRGPVLGPMVYGIAFCPLDSEQVLIDLGCADSKQLTEEKREIIFNNVNTSDNARNCIGWAIDIISPNIISTSMNRRSKCSLNEVSMNSAIGLINLAIDAGVNVAAIFVDTVGPPEKYELKLKGLFPNVEKITVAKKADSTYPIVSAASICAKVTRDHALKVWKFPECINLTSKDFGSGYPGDPVTKQFLSNNIDNVFGFPRLVRFSWSTAENALADIAYEMEFDEPDNEKATIKYAGAKLTQFFKQGQRSAVGAEGGAIKRQRCRFYKERFLDNVTEF